MTSLVTRSWSSRGRVAARSSEPLTTSALSSLAWHHSLIIAPSNNPVTGTVTQSGPTNGAPNSSDGSACAPMAPNGTVTNSRPNSSADTILGRAAATIEAHGDFCLLTPSPV